MIRYDLFPTSIYKTTIDPKSYEKDLIVNTCLENYKIDPNRNKWEQSELHHLYDDWDNNNFNKIDMSSLHPIYQEKLDQLFNSLKWTREVKYNWYIANVAVNTKRMEEHDHHAIFSCENVNPGSHKQGQAIFSCIHYIKFNNTDHKPTYFRNPLPVATFPLLIEDVKSALHDKEIINSPYYGSWHLDNEEDDFVIFPSWTKHRVDPGSLFEQCPRIVSVVNVELILNRIYL